MGFAKWKVRQGPGTHYLMDGGILDVPNKDTDAFMLEYLASLRRGDKVYVVEQKTEVFRFFVDLDWRDAEPLSDERLLEILQVMCSVVPGRCIVARAPIRLEEDGRTKSGVHIHWPETKVRRSEALAFRTRILLELGDDPAWNERIDLSVYGGSGLRMIGSHKMPTGDPYVPWTPGEESQPITIEDIKAFSIRTEETDVTKNITEVSNFGPIETYIRKYIPGQAFARVKRIGRKSPQCLWVQTDSKWCANIQGEHKSNHVWFYIYGDTICQRCHDEDTCKGFVGKEYILSPSIVEELTSNVSVDRSTFVCIRDLVPAHWFPADNGEPVRTGAPSILGAGSRRVASVQAKHWAFELEEDVAVAARQLYSAMDNIRNLALGVQRPDDAETREKIDRIADRLAVDGEYELYTNAKKKGLYFFPRYLNNIRKETPDDFKRGGVVGDPGRHFPDPKSHGQ